MSGIHAGNTRIEYDTIGCTAFLVVDPIVHPTKNIVTILLHQVILHPVGWSNFLFLPRSAKTKEKLDFQKKILGNQTIKKIS